MEVCCIIGPTKSGTTLLSSLLDSHPEVTIFPLEVKFFSHWLEQLRNKNPTYHDLNEFFLVKSKLKFLDISTRALVDIMNSGRVDFQGFDFERFRSSMLDREESNVELGLDSLFKTYLQDIHVALSTQLGQIRKPTILVSKEGNHGLPHIEAIKSLFTSCRFIVVVRDPRDIYASLKAIAKKKRAGVSSPTFKAHITPVRYVFENSGKNVLAYTNLFEELNDAHKYHFVRYEDLVTNVYTEMERIASFLGITVDDSLCSPTTFGNPWGGNASSMDNLLEVSPLRKNKWGTELTLEETKILDFFFWNYLGYAEYKRPVVRPARTTIAKEIITHNSNSWRVNWLDAVKPMWRCGKNVFLMARALVQCIRG